MPLTNLKPALGALLIACTGCEHPESEPLDPVAELGLMAARSRRAEVVTASSNLPAELFPLAGRVDPGNGLTLAEADTVALLYAPALAAARRDLRLRSVELLRAGLLPNPELFLGPRLTTRDGGLVLPASLGFGLPLGGRLEAEEQRAAAEIEAARSRLLDSEARTLVAVRRHFIALAALARRRAILQEVVEAGEDALARIGQLVEAGEADRVALGLAVLDRDQALRDLRAAEARSREVQVELLSGIGLLPGSGVAIDPAPQLLEPLPLPARDSSLLLHHPHLKALEARYRAAEHGLEIEVARQYPELNIGPEFESDEGLTSFGLGLSVTLPLFDRNTGGIAVARERRAAGREAWRAALLELARREARARARHDEARSLLERIRERTIPAADAAEEALRARRLSGQSSLVETLAARNAIARARLREVELMREAALRSLEVLWYSGRLFPAMAGADRTGDER